MQVLPANLDIIDSDDFQAETAVIASTNNQTILSCTAKNNMRCFISFVGDAWDAALDTLVTKRLLVNGGVLPRFRNSTVQWAAPEQTQNELSPWQEIPQGSIIEYQADIGAAAGNVTARIKLYYAALAESNLGGR